jgi:hypothetical protein
VVGLDLHWDMLRENAVQRGLAGGRWTLAQADIRLAPLAAGCAALVTAGWAVGHMRAWFSDAWQANIGQALREMHRIAAPGGWIAIMETLTTGGLAPEPPTPALAEYYAWLEIEWGFARQAISTDYQFASVEEAVELTEFFFGPELSAKIRAHGWSRLPEWTGVWTKLVA